MAGIVKKIYDSKIYFFTLNSIRKIIGINNESSFYFVLKKLLIEKVLLKVERNKYVLNTDGLNDFALACFLYPSSYISFESALNYYGILPQISYEITSVTVKKTKVKIFNEKTFSYLHIKKTLFWGYEKRNDFLIALPEKALSDQLYFWAKGLKSLNIDELNLEMVDKKRLKEFILRYPLTKQTNKIYELLNKL